MPSSSDQTRVGRTLTLGGDAESSLEGSDFELSLKIQPKENRGFSGLAINGIVPQTGAK